jgi:hypothetical protein
MAIDFDEVSNVNPHKSSNDERINIKLAQWAKDEYLDWIEGYLAACSVFNGPYISESNVNELDDWEYILVFYWPHTITVFNSFLERESSASRANALRHLARKSKPSYSESKLIRTREGTLSLEANQPLGLLLTLIRDIAPSEVDVLAGSNKKIDQAISDFKKYTIRLHEALGPEMSPFLTGERLQLEISKELQSQVDLENDLGLLPIQLRPENNPVINQVLIFQERRSQEILEAYADRLGDSIKSDRNPLYQSNHGVPTLQLYRIKRLTYLLIKITDIDTVKNTQGIYSLIAYLVGLSLTPEAESCDLLKANEVKKQVDSAIKLWKKHKPENI